METTVIKFETSLLEWEEMGPQLNSTGVKSTAELISGYSNLVRVKLEGSKEHLVDFVINNNLYMCLEK